MLLYHPESESYLNGDEMDLFDNPKLCDVTGEDDHELAAQLYFDGLEQYRSEFNARENAKFFGDDDFMSCDLPEPVIETGGVAGAIAKSMAKWIRKPADLYPTPEDVTISLLHYLQKNLPDLVPVGSWVLEPACADGQMSKVLEQYGYHVDSTDLRPDVKHGTGGVDFLDPTTYFPDNQYQAVFTNPPFNAAAEFVEQALTIAPVVIFLLKAQYWNTGNRKKLFRKTKPFMELNLTWRPAFLEAERGKSPLMDCMWVVWVRGHDDLPKMDIIDRHFTLPLTEESFNGL